MQIDEKLVFALVVIVIFLISLVMETFPLEPWADFTESSNVSLDAFVGVDMGIRCNLTGGEVINLLSNPVFLFEGNYRGWILGCLAGLSVNIFLY
ncbi:hypothetical protein VH13_03080 [Corynebacterium ulcerans]|nr:hypothetical protein VH13_03080 [Corynebacterium ulcerans]KKO88085.1 hypothetical protein VH15_01790 [Corynebacterium ulcerans]